MSPDLRLKKIEILPTAEYHARGLSRPGSKNSLAKQKNAQMVQAVARKATLDSVSSGANSENFDDTLIEEPSNIRLSTPLNFNL